VIATTPIFALDKISESRINQVDWNNLGFGKVFSDHMFVVEYREGKWQPGNIMPYGPIPFSPAISALHYGQAIFEGMKAYRNERGEIYIFRPEKNAERMNRSAQRMCMPDMPKDVFMEAVTQLVSFDKDWVPDREGAALYIRPVMFSVDEYVGVRPSENYMFIVFTCPVDKYYTGDLKVRIEKKYTRASKGGTGYAKAAGNYAASLLPTRYAQQAGYNQILWTDGITHEYFEESGTMNVIFRSGNTVFTPMISDSILDGVTRDSVLTLARDWGYNVEERKVSVKEVIELLEKGELNAAFGTGTAATIAPIGTIHYEGKDYVLPPVETREFSNRAAKELDLIKRGMMPDVHNWSMRVV